MENDKLIAIFMGWYILIKTTEDYPTQEWHTTKNSITKDWSSSKCVHLDKDPIKKRIEVDNELWKSLCNKNYGSAGKYDSSWDLLMPVVEKIESINNTLHYYGNSVTISDNYVSIKCRKEGIDEGEFFILFDHKVRDYKTKIEGVYKAVIEFINWYNKKQK